MSPSPDELILCLHMTSQGTLTVQIPGVPLEFWCPGAENDRKPPGVGAGRTGYAHRGHCAGALGSWLLSSHRLACYEEHTWISACSTSK